MKQRFSINLAVLMEEMVQILLHSDEIDADDNGVWGTLNGEFIQLSWADLMDIRDSPDINSSTKADIHQLMEERGKA